MTEVSNEDVKKDARKVIIADDSEQFRWTKLIIPGVMLGAGFVGAYNGWCKDFNQHVKDRMSTWRGDCYFHYDDYIQFLTGVGYLTVGFIPKVKCKHSFRERLLAGVTAYAVMAAVTNGIKYSVKEMRPDSSARNSFPSGHTATVFTGAELMRLEYGSAIGLGAYVVATGVAILRLYNERHWLNDVIAGAGIGILSANVGYWLLPYERKLFKLKPKQDISLVPYYSPFGGTNVGVCMNLIY